MAETLSIAGLLHSLSMALDLVEGQPEGHAARTASISVTLGKALGLDRAFLTDIYFASVLKDSGCSNNSVRVQKIFGGDEILTKYAVKFIDWTSPLESAVYAFRNTERGKSIIHKLRRMAAQVKAPGSVMNEVTLARCTRGAQIAAMLQFSERVGDGIHYLDEHWDGKGAPYGMRGDAIPLIAQIVSLAQTFEVFATAYGVEAAYTMAEKRTHTWFNPELVHALQSFRHDQAFWETLGHQSIWETELPELDTDPAPAEVDHVCEAFALIVDAKSSFTAEHSSRVTSYAVRLAEAFGFDEERKQTLRRAGLLHDVGKLGVPTAILEKPGKLDDEEFARIRNHPRFSDLILRRIPTFERIADLASSHHERLDGKGYWRGLSAEQLDLDMRILTACDVYDALTAERPYRGPMEPGDALEIMQRDVNTAFDPACLTALRDLANPGTEVPSAA